jgi:hypothetical protein
MDRAERARLEALVTRLLTGDVATEAEGDLLLDDLERSVPRPDVSDLLYHPAVEFDHEPSAAEIVERALAHRPFELGADDD